MDTAISDAVCPYCGEMITLFVDQTEQNQQYIEDCAVCCRPILVCVRVNDQIDGQIDDRIDGQADDREAPVMSISLYHENEVPNP